MSDQPIDYDPPFVPRLRNARNRTIIIDDDSQEQQQQQQPIQPVQSTLTQFFNIVDKSTAINNVQNALQVMIRERPRVVVTSDLNTISASVPPPLPRQIPVVVRTGKKGRPKGSFRRPNASFPAPIPKIVSSVDLPVKRGKGRPKGSLNRVRPALINNNTINDPNSITIRPIPVNPATGKRPRGRPRIINPVLQGQQLFRGEQQDLQQLGFSFDQTNAPFINQQDMGEDIQMQDVSVTDQLMSQLQYQQILEESNTLRILGDNNAADALLARIVAGEELNEEEWSIVNAGLQITATLETTLDKLNNNIPLTELENQFVERLSQGDSPEKTFDDLYITASQLGLFQEFENNNNDNDENVNLDGEERPSSLSNYREMTNQVKHVESQTTTLNILNNSNNTNVMNNTNTSNNNLILSNNNLSNNNNNNNNSQDIFESTPEFMRFLGTGFGSQNEPYY